MDATESPGGLAETQIADSVIVHFNKFSGDVDAAGPGTTLGQSLIQGALDKRRDNQKQSLLAL